ncbi:MAG: hypothetical protein ACR2L2_10465 [Acidobacteriota bacterium]
MRKIILLVIVLSCSATGLKAEVNAKNSTGVEPIYSYKGGLNEAINLYNGNLNVSLPILSLKGRAGMDLSLYFSYDSRQFRVWNDVCGTNAEWNYEGQTTGRWIPSFAPQIVAEGTYGSGLRWAEVQLEGGARHRFDEQGYPRGQSTNATDMTYNFYYKNVSTKGGLWYQFSDPLRILKVDANGNYQAFIRDYQGRTTQIQDNLGRAVNISYEDFYQPQLPTHNRSGPGGTNADLHVPVPDQTS